MSHDLLGCWMVGLNFWLDVGGCRGTGACAPDFVHVADVAFRALVDIQLCQMPRGNLGGG